VRPMTDAEYQLLEAGWRSSAPFILRRCQILRASARGQPAPQIAHQSGCDHQTVRNAIHHFYQRGLDCLANGSSRPHTIHAAFTEKGAQALKAFSDQWDMWSF